MITYGDMTVKKKRRRFTNMKYATALHESYQEGQEALFSMKIDLSAYYRVGKELHFSCRDFILSTARDVREINIQQRSIKQLVSNYYRFMSNYA